MAKKTAKKERVVCVSLRSDGTLRIEPDPVRVKAGYRVRWVTIVREAKKIEVSFTKRWGTPFKEAHFTAPAPGQLLSSAVAKLPDGVKGKSKSFKYTLALHVGKHTFRLDPEVEVER